MRIKLVQKMNIGNKKNNENQENLNILLEISKNSTVTQRKMANKLGFSLGKLNYCLIKLKDRGAIKINNFRKSKKKYRYIYLLTPKGVSLKTNLIINFMKKKIEEYDKLKIELEE